MRLPIEALSSVSGSSPSGFLSDARFAAAATFVEPLSPPEPDMVAVAAPIDPIVAAFGEGYAAGRAEARDEAARRTAEDTAAREALTLALARIDAARAQQLAARLRETVAALCEAALAPLALDIDALAARATRCAALFAEAEAAVTIHFHPDDMPLVAAELGSGWALAADASLERGALRVESAAGGAEDGPAQWRRAVSEAIGRC